MVDENEQMKRRNFLAQGSLMGSAIVMPKFDTVLSNRSMTKDGMTILFQGDSITDAGRDRAHYYPNQSGGMGSGYVRLIVSQLLGQHADKGLQFYNRGISGNKVYQLADRWEDDCLHLQPDVLSILIGVNDYWHTLDWDYEGTVSVYENDLRALLKRTRDQLPEVKLIIGEPFTVEGGTHIDLKKWYPTFAGYQQAAKSIADDFGAAFIPYQQIFADALTKAPASHWCPDGVHPSMAGCWLMAEAWMNAFEQL